MKNYLVILFLLLGIYSANSQVVTGVYRGKMEVDSPKYTVDFELTLKEKDGKLVGYCQRLFIVEDILYYNLVKVTARIADSVLIVEDDKSVSNNFKEKTSGVKTVMFFKIQHDQDTVSVMPGEWSTSRTKKYLPITGSVSVSRERNYLATQLYKRLDEKQLGKEMLFEEKVQPQTSIAAKQPDQTKKPQTKPETKRIDVAINSSVTNQPQPTRDTVQLNNSATVNNTNQTKPTDIAVQQKKPVGNVAVTGIDSVKSTLNTTINTTAQTKPTDVAVQQNKPPVTVTQQQKPVIKDSVKTTATTATTNPSQQTVTTSNSQQQKPSNTIVTNKPAVTGNVQQQSTAVTTKPETKPAEQKPVTPVAAPQQQSAISSIGNTIVQHNTTLPAGPSKPPVINNPVIVKRQTEIIDALELSGDSVTLSLYDNGEIDGDTVSVFVNNELVMSKVGLKASAYKQTIAIEAGEVIQLTLFAENLGSIPPNTGLLVITTNNERYQIHFSSTLNKSSSIVLRRKE